MKGVDSPSSDLSICGYILLRQALPRLLCIPYHLPLPAPPFPFSSSSVAIQGFVGVTPHLSMKLEAVASFPPYDEFRLLEDAWRALRPIIEV